VQCEIICDYIRYTDNDRFKKTIENAEHTSTDFDDSKTDLIQPIKNVNTDVQYNRYNYLFVAIIID